ncbi:acetoin utilization deacetylase AcuC-like enzyme [Desulfitispora alkaliphila]|uniref:histone deacetylase family protein n=1 Tax=Desulfitispora alkaliphila TaxID=622674 RepID=UPI003D201EAF
MHKVGLITSSDYLLHDTQVHPESKKRIIEIEKHAKENNLWDRFVFFEPEKITLDQLTKIHTPEYVSCLERFAASGGGRWDPDTVVCDKSYEIALLSCGGAVKAVDLLLEGEVSKAFALIRPPGHHAERDRGMGYCLFNNTAMSAVSAKNYDDIEKVAIIDIDAHHGNGIEKIFYEDATTLYLSIHQSPLFPGTGFIRNSGSGDGEGYNINIPILKQTGYSGYYFAVKKIIEPILNQYKPNLIIVALGLDAYYMDPLTNLSLDAKGYEMLTDEILAISEKLCDGKAAFILEGGYSIPGVGKPAAAVMSRLMNVKLKDAFYEEKCDNSFSPEARERLDSVIKWQKRYWQL